MVSAESWIIISWIVISFDNYHSGKKRLVWRFLHLGHFEISFVLCYQKLMPYVVSFVFLIEREFLMPGMVDTHLHAPQYAFCGTRVGLPLLEWLDKYTFPIEAKYKDTHFAEEIYSKVVVSDQLYYQVFPTEFSHNTESWQLWHLRENSNDFSARA